ncbi:hypothetical protein PY247_11135 [Acinetobacter proteolyticus]|nr:hypothetical protein [Acinetobacter proteolyticus]WEI17117.1 hypothetical protein PY247_11135 [Acinetobacter proteolyticus]
MHTLLSVQLAFEAKQAGKNVVCRHIDADEFQSLKDVSANTWFDPDFVFALQIDTITLGGYEFTRPYSLDELILNDDVYYVGASGTILKGKFNPENEMLVSAVKNGSVQRDEENAIKQIKAFRSLLGIDGDTPQFIDYDFFVVDGEPKKRGVARKKKEITQDTAKVESSEHEPLDESDTNVKKTIDSINSATNLAELDFIENELKSSPRKYVQDELNQFHDLINQKREELNQLALFNDSNPEISESTELDTPSFISELKELQKDALNLTPYQTQLSDLINQVQKAQSIDEANEPVSQTLDWTFEQRLPLITAISKRLVELGKPLIAQIREANDFNTLDAYLVQIHELIAVDGTLAHQCMQALTVRKSALTPTSPA